MKESFKAYLEYLDSEEEFSYRVRMEREWDDKEYQHLIALVMAAVNDYKDTDLIPIPVMLFFTSQISYLVGIISNPDFFINTSPAYKELVTKRKEELLDLQKRFFSGELLMKG